MSYVSVLEATIAWALPALRAFGYCLLQPGGSMAQAGYQIDDAKSVIGNHEIFVKRLVELDPVLGPVLATFLAGLTKEPACEKSEMLRTLRSELDKVKEQ